ncbi:hypothetical protein [Vibrio vulnificus]|uniref:hypothetical protein n=1 Tax=Vibrio vulnificus TaxID=672 RepID=UPI00220232B5|nr:hypothetical protein [Vibrio vulnificus]MDF4719809.1 hypothetical protein [Vibrio parahaemolyticus]BDP31412.1 hypothetical protein VV208B2_24920 [Vibrio vulnificus]HCG6476970.1 hypothetical protein [Vibrio parahaemolyticus]
MTKMTNVDTFILGTDEIRRRYQTVYDLMVDFLIDNQTGPLKDAGQDKITEIRGYLHQAMDDIRKQSLDVRQGHLSPIEYMKNMNEYSSILSSEWMNTLLRMQKDEAEHLSVLDELNQMRREALTQKLEDGTNGKLLLSAADCRNLRSWIEAVNSNDEAKIVESADRAVDALASLVSGNDLFKQRKMPKKSARKSNVKNKGGRPTKPLEHQICWAYTLIHGRKKTEDILNISKGAIDYALSKVKEMSEISSLSKAEQEQKAHEICRAREEAERYKQASREREREYIRWKVQHDKEKQRLVRELAENSKPKNIK